MMLTVVTSPAHIGNLYIAKAIKTMLNNAHRSSVSNASSDLVMLLPSIKFCNIDACMRCGNMLPTGVGTGLATPSALTPTMTNFPPKSGSSLASTYSCSSNVLLNLIYAVPSGCVTIGSNGGTANSCTPSSLVFKM